METEEAGASGNRTTRNEFYSNITNPTGPVFIGDHAVCRITEQEGRQHGSPKETVSTPVQTSSSNRAVSDEETRSQDDVEDGQYERIDIAAFVERIEDSVNDFDRMKGHLWEEKQKYILEVILPGLEKCWRDSSSKTNIYEALSKLSYSRSSSQVVHSSLELSLHLIKVDPELVDGDVHNLLGVEEIVRSSFNSVFKKERYEEKELRMCLYSQILTIICIQATRDDRYWFFVVDTRSQLLELQNDLKKYYDPWIGRKITFTLSFMKIIQNCIAFLLNPSWQEKTRAKRFLHKCQENEDKEEQEDMELSFLRELRRAGKNINQYWFAVYCVTFYLFGKVHRSTKKPAILLLRYVIDACREGGGGKDPNFACQAAWFLSDVAKNHASTEIKEIAEDCLAALAADKKVQKNQRSREIVERFSSEVFSRPEKEEPPAMKSDNVPRYTDLQEKHSNRSQGSFSHFTPYRITKEKDRAVMQQRMKCVNEKVPLHWDRLRKLEHTNIGLNCSIYRDNSHLIMDIVSPETRFGNLKEYVLDGNCQRDAIIEILLQVASAQHYLHENHIVHGDLRAEHVHVVGPCKVKVVFLGRSKSLALKANEDNSKSCVVHDDMPTDSTRWSAPEVITEGRYSHASDVWAFGVVVWELFVALEFGRPSKDKTLPYYERHDAEILGYIQNGGLLPKPSYCYDPYEWIYKVMKDCWLRPPTKRPTFQTLFITLGHMGLDQPKNKRSVPQNRRSMTYAQLQTAEPAKRTTGEYERLVLVAQI